MLNVANEVEVKSFCMALTGFILICVYHHPTIAAIM